MIKPLPSASFQIISYRSPCKGVVRKELGLANWSSDSTVYY